MTVVVSNFSYHYVIRKSIKLKQGNYHDFGLHILIFSFLLNPYYIRVAEYM